MRESGIRDIQTANLVAAELDAMRLDGARVSKPRAEAGKNSGGAGPMAPIEESNFSLIHEYRVAIAAERAALSGVPADDTRPGPSQPLVAAYNDLAPRGEAACKALIRVLGEAAPQQAAAVYETARSYLAVMLKRLALLLDVPTFECPMRHLHDELRMTRSMRKHIEENVSTTGKMVTADARSTSKVRFVDSGIRGNTVVPDYVIPGGVQGVVSCFHPSCYDQGGRRAHFGLDALFRDGNYTPLTWKQYEKVWGFSVSSMYMSLVHRPTVPVAKAGERMEDGKLVATFCIGDVQEHRSMARRLAKAIDTADA